jgi:hypothetical protein
VSDFALIFPSIIAGKYNLAKKRCQGLELIQISRSRRERIMKNISPVPWLSTGSRVGLHEAKTVVQLEWTNTSKTAR